MMEGAGAVNTQKFQIQSKEKTPAPVNSNSIHFESQWMENISKNNDIALSALNSKALAFNNLKLSDNE